MQSGFFQLKTAQDLFRKLENDFSRIKDDPLNQYAAFDFFVTAEHMLDWEMPGYSRKKDREDEQNKHKILAVC
jgi:hypothetical protein